MNESIVQQALARYLLTKKAHKPVVPNIKSIFAWECDLLSITQAGLLHEWEIKLSKSDFKRDKVKVAKHKRLASRKGWIPSYFWYVTYKLDGLDIPDYAGWIEFANSEFIVRKNAPRLHDRKASLGVYKRISTSLWLRSRAMS